MKVSPLKGIVPVCASVGSPSHLCESEVLQLVEYDYLTRDNSYIARQKMAQIQKSQRAEPFAWYRHVVLYGFT